MMRAEYHEHGMPSGPVPAWPVPQVQAVQLTLVTFRRGIGCCAVSPVRQVDAYYDADGTLLFEHDPYAKESTDE